MSLEALRKKIDEADDRIVRLLAERMRIAQEIGGEKSEQGKQVEDRAREEVVLAKIRSLAQRENISPEGMETIYQQIMTVSKSLQEILFTSSREGDIEIFFYLSEGFPPRNLTRNEASDEFPVWMPDGESFLFESIPSSSHSR